MKGIWGGLPFSRTAAPFGGALPAAARLKGFSGSAGHHRRYPIPTTWGWMLKSSAPAISACGIYPTAGHWGWRDEPSASDRYLGRHKY